MRRGETISTALRTKRLGTKSSQQPEDKRNIKIYVEKKGTNNTES